MATFLEYFGQFKVFFSQYKDIISLVIGVLGLFGTGQFVVVATKKFIMTWKTTIISVSYVLMFVASWVGFLTDDTPITRLDIVMITYLTVMALVFCFVVMLEINKKLTIQTARIKYGLFHDGDMDIPDNLPVQKKCHSPTREG